jgi:hypothetical protein
MTDKSIETSAAAATSTDADPSEGLGLAQPAAHGDHLVAGGPGETGDVPVRGRDERVPDTAEDADAVTEGARSVQEGHAAAADRARTD